MINLKINIYGVYDNLNLLCKFNLGYEDMVQSFFSTIAYNLENQKWGSVYPVLMNEFYKGKLEQNRIDYAIAEIKDIKKKLSQLKVSKMIWNIEDLSIKAPIDPNLDITLDNIFINSNGEKITDIILKVLGTIRNKKIPLYIGEYYYKELENPEIIDIINKTQKKQKINRILKYIAYLLIVLLVKFIVNEEQFNKFIKMFIFSMIVAELFYYHSKQIIKSKQKELEEKRKLRIFDISPKIRIEKITLKRDLRSSRFDYILDKINCPKTFSGIKEKLELKKIKTWQSDLKKIHKYLGYDISFAEDIIDSFKQYEKLEFYELKSDTKVIPEEIRGDLYEKDYIYRIINTNDGIYLLVFKNEIQKY